MKDHAASAPILNQHIPDAPWMAPRSRGLPGISPLNPADWLWVLDSYGAQMAARERLLAEQPDAVHALLPEAEAAAQELFDLVLNALVAQPGFRRTGAQMHCPDGRVVALDRDRPLITLGRLVQEDLCLMQKPQGAAEHVLTAAVLCFPASWTLAEKIGRPLLRIHRPVEEYDAGIAARVQRLFDGIQPGRPLWRCNVNRYRDASLFHPRREDDPRHKTDANGAKGQEAAPYLRSERQCLLRLPQTRAVVFSIHTMVMRFDALNAAQAAPLDGWV